jgi:RNA polymerase sigma-70 factor (ECF subfamily)
MSDLEDAAMSDSSSQSSLFKRLKTGNSSAANQVDHQYRSKLCQLVERKMNQRFKRREDPEDVVQSAFRSFYRRNAQGEFRIDSSVDLWRLLETITRHKLLKHVEKHNAGKRDDKKEKLLEGDAFHGREPTPQEAAIAVDLMEKTLAGLDETYTKVFHMRLQNCTEEEIAKNLDCTRAYVRTKLKRLRERLEHLSNGNSDE